MRQPVHDLTLPGGFFFCLPGAGLTGLLESLSTTEINAELFLGCNMSSLAFATAILCEMLCYGRLQGMQSSLIIGTKHKNYSNKFCSGKA